MNPGPFQMAALKDAAANDRRDEAARRAALHARAIARRKKAKRGGPR